MTSAAVDARAIAQPAARPFVRERIGPGLLFAALAAVAFAVLLYLGRHGSFFQDEWTFIRLHGFGTPIDWFTPHNEHWSTLPMLAYRMLVLTVGLHSYVPYLALLLVLHLVASAGLFVLLRRLAGPWAALGGAAIFLFLGSAYQNLFWAFQIGFIGSAAAGLWALVALHVLRDRPRRRAVIVAVLLLAADMSSAIGLPFLVAAAVTGLLEPRGRRPLVLAVGLAVTTFVAWYILIGRSGTGTLATDPLALGRFVAVGSVATLGALTGLRDALPALAIVGILAVSIVEAVRGRLSPWAVGAAAGFVALLVLVGIGRGAEGDAAATRPRYLYETGALLLVGLGALLGGFARPAPHLATRPMDTGRVPSDDRRDPRPVLRDRVALAIVAVVVALALTRNVPLLASGARFYAEGAGELRAQIALMNRYGPAMPYEPPPLTRWSIPTPSQLREYIAAYGSPAVDVLYASDVRAPKPVELDRALWRLIGGALTPVPGGSASTTSQPPALASADAGLITRSGSCLVVHPSATPATTSPGPTSLDVHVPDGGSIVITSQTGGSGSLGLARYAPPDAFDLLAVAFPAGSPMTVHAPSLGDAADYVIRVILPPSTAQAEVCAAAA